MAGISSVVFRALPNMSPADLQQVLLKTKLLLGQQTTHVTATEPSADYLLDGFHFELRRRGLLGPNVRLPRQVFPDSYVQSSMVVRHNLDSRMPQLNRTEKAALGRLAARCLADWLIMNRIPVRPKTLLVNVGNIAVALDWAFPGYLEDGYLPWCWASTR